MSDITSYDWKSLIKPGLGLNIIGRSEFSYDYWNGKLLCWEPPQINEEYILGVDSAEGIGADRSVLQVIKRGNLIHPDIQVAEFASDFISPVDFAGIVNTVGRFYADPDGGEAFITIEVNNPAGTAIQNTLRTRWDYTNMFERKDYEKRENMIMNKVGWHTTRQNRGIIIARSQHALMYGDLLINSPFLVEEMADFESNFDMAAAKAKSKGGHDDRIMSLMIAYYGGHDYEWLSGEDIAEERRLLMAARAQADKIVNPEEYEKPKGGRDFQNTAISARDMWARADAALFD